MDQHSQCHSHGKNCCSGNSVGMTSVNDAVKAERRTTLRIEGMCCADEVAAVQRTLKAVDGIGEIHVNLIAGTVIIAHEEQVTPEMLIEAIAKAGMHAWEAGESHGRDGEQGTLERQHLLSVVGSGVFLGLGLLLEWKELLEPYGYITAFVIAIITGGWFILPKALRALNQRSLDMNVLMSVAVIGAAAIGQWSESAAVVFLFSLSELLESFSVSRVRGAIKELLKISPMTALVKRGVELQEVGIQEVSINETIIIRSGARIPLDGIVVAGRSTVDQAPITGESMPVEKKANDVVFAGTINGGGLLEARVTKASGDTMLSRIIRLVGEAETQKAPSQRFVDRFAKIYTPAVFLLAIVVLFSGPLLFHGSWSVWVYRALVFLVIACPCALVISTPVSIVSGLTAMTQHGILIKGGAILEQIGKLNVLAIDKTGTITEGRPRVMDVKTFNSLSKEDVVRIAASIDAHSTHPLSQAIVRYATETKISFPRSEDYQAKPGLGAEGKVGDCEYFVGNHHFAHLLGVCTPEVELTLTAMENQSQSVVVIGHKPHGNHDGDVLGVIAVADTIRENAAGAVRALHRAGVKNVVMLSGDNQKTVDAIAEQAGIDEAYGDLLPEDKLEKVKVLIAKHNYVAMVGDGVNDAPAMALASVGIAMGGVGTDTAIETADIVLMKDDLSKVAEAVLMGRRTVNIIKANIAFALTVKGVFLILAFFGYTSLWLAILADMGATLIVIANALRLLVLKR